MKNKSYVIFVLCLLSLAIKACGDAVPANLLTALSACVPPNPSKTQAAVFLKELKSANAENDQRFLYYKAVALVAVGQKDEALKAAEAALTSSYVPTLATSRQLVRDLKASLAPPTTDPNDGKRYVRLLEEYFQSSLKDYPYGSTEALRLRYMRPPSQMDIGNDLVFFPKHDMTATLRAAQTYGDMNMFASAERLYNRLEGWDSNYASPDAIVTWSDLATCNERQGKWEIAEGYLIKTMINRGANRDRLNAFTRLESGLKGNKKTDMPAAEPDAGKLEEILIWCADTQLFADAMTAIEEIQALAKSPSVRAQLTLHQDIVDMIQQMRRCGIDDAKVRGIDANAATLKEERQLVDELKRELPAATNTWPK
jgi:tetratricopeptide (TPR) repeat protein